MIGGRYLLRADSRHAATVDAGHVMLCRQVQQVIPLTDR